MANVSRDVCKVACSPDHSQPTVYPARSKGAWSLKTPRTMRFAAGSFSRRAEDSNASTISSRETVSWQMNARGPLPTMSSAIIPWSAFF